MTKKLFWENMYLRAFEARVDEVDGVKVQLDQTAFNPRGGGLVSDTGTLGGLRVTEVTKEGDRIFHAMQGPIAFKAGETVHGELDWDRRHRIMRMHTAAHILSAVVHRETRALITGNQISPDESRVDFNLADFDRGKIAGFVDGVNEAVGRGLEVKTFFMKREEALATPGFVKLANAMPPNLEELRIVQIGDVDTQADGGVHVANTHEIGRVAVVKAENKGKDNRRLYFTVEESG